MRYEEFSEPNVQSLVLGDRELVSKIGTIRQAAYLSIVGASSSNRPAMPKWLLPTTSGANFDINHILITPRMLYGLSK